MQSRYVESTLTGDEKIAHTEQASLIQYGASLVLGILSFLMGLTSLIQDNATQSLWGKVLFSLGLLLIIRPFFIRLTSEYAITTKRVVGKYGFIARKTFDLRLSKVENVQVNQSVFGRIFGYGDIFIGTAGGNTPIKGVKKPIEFRKKIVEIQEKNQS